jgi:hypothetical protein
MMLGAYGAPKNIFEYSKTCDGNYPNTIDKLNTDAKTDITTYAGNTDSEKKAYMTTYTAATGELYKPKGDGDYTVKVYCDGGASALVAATAAAVAVTVSLH